MHDPNPPTPQPRQTLEPADAGPADAEPAPPAAPADRPEPPTPEPPDNDDPTQRLAAAQEELTKLRAELDAARRQVDAAERRQRIDQLLVDADAVDLESARLLTEAAVERMDAPDLALAVDDLRRLKPFLFRRRDEQGAMSPRPRPTDPADEAAAHAAASGHRRDLLRYLRLRRAPA